MLAVSLHESRSAEVPPARTVLALCGPAGAADRRGARLARSRAARRALRADAASVLHHARPSPAPRAGLFARARSLARRRRVSRNRQRREPSLSGAVLARRRRAVAAGVRDRRAW